MFDIEENKELLNNCYEKFRVEWPIYQHIYLYYLGLTDVGRKSCIVNSYGDYFEYDDFMYHDSINTYSKINSRNNHKTSTNYIKRFIKEEVSYSVGAPITYISRSGDDAIADVIKYNLAHWKENHESELAKTMLIHGVAYELYYIDKEGQFCSRIISPRHGLAYTDDEGNVILFLHIFKKQFDDATYIDIYTDTEIIHCNENFEEIAPRQPHTFGRVPVGVALISEENWLDTLYHDIKSLQDSYETNLSDISTEITDGLRNAYLWLNNVEIKEEDTPKMKRLGMILTKGDANVKFVTKEINDSFIQNTLKTLQENMFFISSHINPNEKMQSNTSGIALRTRLFNLEEKCKLNEKALANCIKTRLQMLFIYLNSLKNTSYDYKDINIKFTTCIPQDDLMTAQIIAQAGDKLSTETEIAQFSFVDNPKEEMKKLQAQNKANSIGQSLLDNVNTGGGDNGQN